MVNKKYIWNECSYLQSQVDEICSNHNISEVTSKLLINRKITNKDDINKFLNPSFDGFHDPFILKDMDIAVNRIMKCRNTDASIMVYGDYDVDGITSTSILYMFLKKQGFDVQYYIPDRLKEGYGLNKEAIKKIFDNGKNLIITVDTGIAAIDEVEYANNLGIDIIVTDHHEVQDQIPKAVAVIDPKRKNCEYPFDMLAGVGVTFKLIHALSLRLNVEDEIWNYIDVVAVGTVADIVPLVDENRIIVKNAFETMPSTNNKGLKALLDVIGYTSDQKITSSTIGYRIGPRLNAAGRLGDAKRGVRLFTTDNKDEAQKIAKELDGENANRQQLEAEILEQAIEIIEKNIDIENTKVIVIKNENWHHGVIGIVSSRITEKYYRPSIILCVEDGVASGSARSVEGFSIFDALIHCRGYLDKFGGHEMAAGLSMDVKMVEKLSLEINKYAVTVMQKETLIPKLMIEAQLKDKDINLSLLDELAILRPFGMGNKTPIFSYVSSVSNVRAIGKEQNHLKLTLASSEKMVDCIGFNYGYLKSEVYKGSKIEIAGQLEKNEWNNVVKPQLIIKDLHEKCFEKDQNKSDVPTKEEYGFVYRILNNWEKAHNKDISFDVLKQLINSTFKVSINNAKVKVCLIVFDELGLITYKINDNNICFKLVRGKKVNIEDSNTYIKFNEK